MTEREDNVYKAKLAEQAERYDGMYFVIYEYLVFQLLVWYLRFLNYLKKNCIR